jgi:hypothetical protein
MGLQPRVAADAVDRALAQVEAQAERPPDERSEPPAGDYPQP